MNGLILSNAAAFAAIGSIFLFRKIFMDKIRAKVFVILWLMVIIRLLLPFEFSSGASLYSFSSEPKTEITVSPGKEYPSGILENEIPDGAFTEKPSASFEKPEKEISSSSILLTIYFSGVFTTGAFFLIRHRLAAKAVLKNSYPFDNLPEIYKSGNTRFYKSKTLASPLSFGILRPVIVIPEETTEEQLPFVLLHERTHTKDRDAVLKLLALCALSINWFNPAVWFMVKFFDRDLERYCDERVLMKIGSEKASSYANTILDFAERESLCQSCFSAASLCERVTFIMKNKNKKYGFLPALAILSALVFIMAACGTLPEEEKNTSSNKEFLELIRTAQWQNIDENTEFIELNDPKLGEISITKSSFDGYDESLFYSWRFEHLPIKKIVIKDLGIPEDNDDFMIFCINDNMSNAINLGDYEYFLEHGFGIEYEQGVLTLYSEKPLSEPSEELSINIFADPNKIEIVSEVTEIRYLYPEFLRDEELLGYYGDDAPNNYVTQAFYPDGDEQIRSVTVKNFSFSDVSFGDIYLYDSEYFHIEATWGDQMREAGFSVDIIGEEAIISTAKKIEDVSEKFDLRIYMDFDSVAFSCPIPVTRILNSNEYPIPDGENNPGEFIELDMEFIWPAGENSYLCADFLSYNGHSGVDIASENEKKDIYATADGKVVEAKYANTGYGYHIIIDHGNGVQTLYAHCSDLFVKLGQEVKAGDLIASMGSTGNSTGTHLHFEIRVNGVYQNPLSYLNLPD